MRDVLFVLVVIGFFSLAALYVNACADLIGFRSELESTDPDNDGEVAD